jgi:AAA15 family ATPase/GTPase
MYPNGCHIKEINSLDLNCVNSNWENIQMFAVITGKNGIGKTSLLNTYTRKM